MTFYTITPEDRELIEAALNKINSNFDSIKYNHTVSAAIRCKNGKVYEHASQNNYQHEIYGALE